VFPPIEKGFFEAARKNYDAVFVACGHGKPTALGIPGAELALDGLATLNAAKNHPNASKAGTAVSARQAAVVDAQTARRAIVIGGGNSAVDVARTLLRLGAEVTIVYRRRIEDMPAFREEIERAVAEGVRIIDLSSPLSLAVGKTGLALSVQKMRPSEVGSDGRMRVVPVRGETETIAADAVYAAVGAGPAETWSLPPADQAPANLGRCSALWTSPAGIPLLFGGDTVNEGESVADAIGSGKQAAIALDVFFKAGAAAVEAEMTRCRVGGGASVSMEIYLGGKRAERAKGIVRFKDINIDYFSTSKRARGGVLDPRTSLDSFSEVEAALETAEAGKQAERCFNCGICNDCDNCRTFCPEVAVKAGRAGRRDWAAETGVDRSVNEDYCKGCGICVTECPRSAMVIEEQQS
jgi:NADPH-dependent glutamate synthase beta subunit-like oxidoreductase